MVVLELLSCNEVLCVHLGRDDSNLWHDLILALTCMSSSDLVLTLTYVHSCSERTSPFFNLSMYTSILCWPNLSIFEIALSVDSDFLKGYRIRLRMLESERILRGMNLEAKDKQGLERTQINLNRARMPNMPPELLCLPTVRATISSYAVSHSLKDILVFLSFSFSNQSGSVICKLALESPKLSTGIHTNPVRRAPVSPDGPPDNRVVDLVEERIAAVLVVVQEHRDAKMVRLRGLAPAEPDVSQPAERVPRPVPPGLAVTGVAVGRGVQPGRGPRVGAARQEAREAVHELVGEEDGDAEDGALEALLGVGLGVLQALELCRGAAVHLPGAVLYLFL